MNCPSVDRTRDRRTALIAFVCIDRPGVAYQNGYHEGRKAGEKNARRRRFVFIRN
jgi:hypothetical protein